jgi:hypothetical protein
VRELAMLNNTSKCYQNKVFFPKRQPSTTFCSKKAIINIKYQLSCMLSDDTLKGGLTSEFKKSFCFNQKISKALQKGHCYHLLQKMPLLSRITSIARFLRTL